LQEYIYHFQEFYKFITPSFHNKNDVIYIQESDADKLFIIYHGSIKIEKILELDFIKNINKKDHELNNLQAKQKKSKLLMKMEKGSIFGHEALEKNQKYKYSAKAESEGTILFCVRIQHSRFKYMIQAIKNYFQPIILKIERILMDAIENIIENQLKMKVGYRGEDLKKFGGYRLNKKEEREFLHKVTEKIVDIRKENLEKIVHDEKNRSLGKLKLGNGTDNEENKNIETSGTLINFVSHECLETKTNLDKRPLSNILNRNDSYENLNHKKNEKSNCSIL